MKSELKDISPTQKEIHLQIDGEALKAAYGVVSKKYANRANVPGFRKGHAPLDVVRIRFRDEIKSEVLQQVVPEHMTNAIIEHDLQPLTEPQLHLENHETVKVNGSEPLSLHIHVEVMPEIPEPKYTGIEVTRRVKPVVDGQIEDLIAERLQQEAALIPVEGRASEIGDTVIADLEGVFDDAPDAEPIKADDLEIVLGDEVIEKSFTDNLAGVNEDDEKSFTVSYPETFSSEALAGRTVHYKAKIKSVGKTEVPELNDEWAQTLDEGFESLKDLRKKLRADLVKMAEADADARVRNNAIGKMIDATPFEIPNTLIENQARNLLNDFARDLQQRGIDVAKVEEQFIQMAYGNMKLQAERDIRGSLLLEKVAKIEKVEVPEADVESEIAGLATMYRTTFEELQEKLESDGGIANIRGNLLTRKSIEAVIAKAVITEGDWIDESTMPLEETEKVEKPKKAEKKKAPAKKAAKK